MNVSYLLMLHIDGNVGKKSFSLLSFTEARKKSAVKNKAAKKLPKSSLTAMDVSYLIMGMLTRSFPQNVSDIRTDGHFK